MVPSVSVPEHITQLIKNWQSGDAAALNGLLPHIYADLRAMASRLLAGEAASTLQPTELVHDTLLKFLGAEALRINDREHFFRLFARLMRNLVVDRVRQIKAQKRGGEWERVDLLEAIDLPLLRDTDAELLHAAIDDLEAVEPRLARIVELRYFVGLSMEDIAKVLQVDERTVYRGWAVARSWLRDQVAT
jgi:RNA polymerase sigma factor (TIGR02999 family)